MAEHDDAHTDPGTSPTDAGREPEAERLHRSVVHTLGRVLIGLVTFVLLAIVIVVLLLQTEWGARQAKDRVVLPLVNNALQEGGELKADRMRGTFITNLRLYDAAIVDSTGQPLATADTASVDFNLLQLLYGRLDVSEAALASPRVTMHQSVDGTWDLIDIFIIPRDTAREARLGLDLEYFALTNGYLEMHFYPPTADSVLIADDLNAYLSEVRVDERLNVRLDTLTGGYVLPGTTDSVRVAAAGQLTDDSLTVRQLLLDSPHSLVRTHGTLRLPGDDVDFVRDVDFELHAEPLAFRDVHPFVPALDPAATLTFSALLGGTSRAIDVDMDGTAGDGATLALEGTVTPGTEGPLTYQLDGEVRRLNPDYFTASTSEQPPLINGRISVDLAGTQLQSLSGTFAADLFDTRVAALDVSEAELQGTVADGEADMSLRAVLPGGAFAAEGGGRFFDDVPTYWVDQGRFDDLNLAAFGEGDGQQTDLSGTITGRGSGFNMDDLAVEASLDLAPSSVGTYQIEGAEARLDFADQLLQFDADARLRGGRFDMSGMLDMQDEVTSYRADGQFYDVDLGELRGTPEPESDLTGAISLRGTGFDPETATIEADLQLSNSTLDGQSIERGVATLTLRNGSLDFDVDFATPGGTFVARGTGSFQGDIFRYSITEGRFDDLDLAAFTGDPGQQSSLTGTFTAEGRGTSIDEMRLEATLDMASSRFGEYQLNDAEVQLTLADQQLQFSTDAQLQGGRFDVSGTADLRGQTPSYSVDGQFYGVDVGTLTNDPQQQSDLTGAITLRGTGFDPETATIEADLQLRGSTLNGQPIERGTADLTLRGGDLRFDADFATPGGAFAAAGTAQFEGGMITYQITEGRFDDLDIATLTGDPTQTSELTGTFTAQGRGTDLASLTLDARLDLERSVYNEQVIEQGIVSLDIEGGTLDVSADVQTPEGGLTLRGTADLTAERLSFALSEGTFSGVNLGALLNNPDLQTDLNGRLIAESGGFNLADGRFIGLIELDTSRINQAVIVDARVDVELVGGTLDAAGRVDFEDGRATFDADALFAGDVTEGRLTRYTLETSLTRIDLGALTGADAPDGLASLDARLTGRGTDPRTMELNAVVTSDDAYYGENAIDELYADVTLSDGVLAVDTLLLEANFADIRADGQAALWNDAAASNLTFDADIRSLAPVRPFLPVETLALEQGHIAGQVAGSRETLRIDATVEARSIVYDDIRASAFEGRFVGTLDSLASVRDGELRAEASYLSLPTITLENTQLRADYAGEEVTFDGRITVDQDRDARFTGAVDLRPGRERLQVDRLDMYLDGDNWELLQPATITYNGQYRVSGFLLHSDDQQIAVDGVIDPDGTQNLIVTVEAFRLDPFTDLLQYEDLGGTVSGTLDLTGPAEAPNLQGTLLSDLTSDGEPVGTLQLDLDYTSPRLQLDALLTHQDRGRLTAEGFITYEFNLASDPGARGMRVEADEPEDGALDFEVAADSFDIGWIRPFVDTQTFDRVDGRLHGRADVGGTLEDPSLSGSAQLVDGVLGLPELGVTYEDIRAAARFDGDRIRISSAQLNAGGGQLTAEGTIDLTRLTSLQFNLTGRARNFLAIDTRDMYAVADADVRLRGTQQRPVVTGNVQVLTGDIYVETNTSAGDLETVELTEQDVQTLERHFGMRLTDADTTTFDFYEASAIELDVELERNTWIRSRSNPELNIQLIGDVDFVKSPYEDEQLFGTIEVVEGRSFIRQFGRRFDVTTGLLRFNGAPTNPIIDAAAEHQVRARNNTGAGQVTITLGITGRLQDPEIELGSDPAMENVDIISYIATGRPAGQSLQADVGTELAMSQVTGLVEGLATENLGLDVVEIQYNGVQGAMFTLGKYFTPRLYAAVRQPINYRSDVTSDQIGTELTLEYELIEWLIARLTQQGKNVRFDLFWEYSY